MVSKLRQRLLLDIAELQNKPYPNIALHVHEDNIQSACLILTTDRYDPMHLSIEFPDEYPLSPPVIEMDSVVRHPNVFDEYICASILNTKEGYTPAYTLKGIAIQLLSFFSSDSIEQVGGEYSIDLKAYETPDRSSYANYSDYLYCCKKCSFGSPKKDIPDTTGIELDLKLPNPSFERPFQSVSSAKSQRAFSSLPDEVLLMICEHMEIEELFVLSEAWTKIGRLITSYDVIRTRELICFCLKKDYKSTELGIGVSISHRGKTRSLASEFDLLSQYAFNFLGIRRSVQGVDFSHWLPLPISHGHWKRVSKNAVLSLSRIAQEACMADLSSFEVICHFMNDIVVKLNQETTEATIKSPVYPYEETAQSTLTHASEKAIESYFHLFHLLICLAVDDPTIVESANTLLCTFIGGKTSKTACPNLGHLLVATLTSDVEITDATITLIIKETITRNVVWMLDPHGANMPELAYLEPTPASGYRVEKTFQASKTSYRLLMFLRLFQQTAVGYPRKSLALLRDEAFERHGAPPRGSAKGLADSIKRIHKIDGFPAFLRAMGVKEIPSIVSFTAFLRHSITESVRLGYSSMPWSQSEALYLRQIKEPNVERGSTIACWADLKWKKSFFPNKQGRGASVHGRDILRGRGRGLGRESERGHRRGRGRGRGRGLGNRGGRGGYGQ